MINKFNVDSLIHARWLLPMDISYPGMKGNILAHHSIAVKDGKILDILPAKEISNKYQALTEYELQRHVVMPGLINCHTHAAMTLFRGLADDLPLMEWLNKHIWPAEQKWVDADFVADGTRHAVAEMIRSGTTCFNDMYFFPEQTARIAEKTGIRAVIGLIVLDFPTAWAESSAEYIYKGSEIHAIYKHNPLVHTAFAPHAPYTVSDKSLQQIGTLAEELDIGIHIHLHETLDEIDQSKEKYGKRPIQRLNELGLMNPRLRAVHMVHLTEQEIELLNEYGIHVVHCPGSNLKLASGICPVNKLLQQDINVVLGTDGASSNNDLDMIGEMRLAGLLAKGSNGISNALPAYQVLEMATIKAAEALGLDQIIGSLSKNKAADIISINLDTIESQPLYDPPSQIIYTANRNQVDNVWVAGRLLLKDGELTTIDKKDVLEKAHNWQKKIKS